MKQFLDCVIKFSVLLRASHRPIFSHFREKGIIAPIMRAPSKQMSCSQLGSGMLNNPYKQATPNYKMKPIGESRLFGMSGHFQKGKSDCVVSVDVLTDFDKQHVHLVQ